MDPIYVAYIMDVDRTWIAQSEAESEHREQAAVVKTGVGDAVRIPCTWHTSWTVAENHKINPNVESKELW